MAEKKRLDVKEQPRSDPNPDASSIFGTMVEAGAGCYVRARDLPRLIALCHMSLRIKRRKAAC